MRLEPGTTLGPYSVAAKIGEGGMGEVYRARDTTLDRDVALKVLPEAFTSDPDRLARFERGQMPTRGCSSTGITSRAHRGRPLPTAPRSGRPCGRAPISGSTRTAGRRAWRPSSRASCGIRASTATIARRSPRGPSVHRRRRRDQARHRGRRGEHTVPRSSIQPRQNRAFVPLVVPNRDEWSANRGL